MMRKNFLVHASLISMIISFVALSGCDSPRKDKTVPITESQAAPVELPVLEQNLIYNTNREEISPQPQYDDEVDEVSNGLEPIPQDAVVTPNID